MHWRLLQTLFRPFAASNCPSTCRKFNEALVASDEAKSLNPLSPDPYIELTMSNIGAEKGRSCVECSCERSILAPDRLKAILTYWVH